MEEQIAELTVLNFRLIEFTSLCTRWYFVYISINSTSSIATYDYYSTEKWVVPRFLKLLRLLRITLGSMNLFTRVFNSANMEAPELKMKRNKISNHFQGIWRISNISHKHEGLYNAHNVVATSLQLPYRWDDVVWTLKRRCMRTGQFKVEKLRRWKIYLTEHYTLPWMKVNSLRLLFRKQEGTWICWRT